VSSSRSTASCPAAQQRYSTDLVLRERALPDCLCLAAEHSTTAHPFGSIDELRAAAALIPAASEIVEVTGARDALGSKTLDVPVLAVDAALRLLP